MTAINNLKGHIVQDGKVVYREDLEPKIVFAVIEMYEPKYEKDNYGDSSILSLKATISTGNKYTWSNGVQSLTEAQEKETVEEKDKFRELRRLTTSQGFKVWEHAYGEYHFVQPDGVKYKARTIKWIVEVPKRELAKFFVN